MTEEVFDDEVYKERMHELMRRWIEKGVVPNLTQAELNTQIAITDYRCEWEMLIRQNKPKLFWTLTFTDSTRRSRKNLKSPNPKNTSRTITDKEAVSTTNELIKRINQSLYGRNKSKYFTGFGCLEYQKCGQPHLHLLITNSLTEKELKNAIDDVLRKQRKRVSERRKEEKEMELKIRNLKIELENSGGDIDCIQKDRRELFEQIERLRKLAVVKNRFKTINTKDMDIQEVYSDRVANYITKVLEPGNQGRILLLSEEGIIDDHT